MTNLSWVSLPGMNLIEKTDGGHGRSLHAMSHKEGTEYSGLDGHSPAARAVAAAAMR